MSKYLQWVIKKQQSSVIKDCKKIEAAFMKNNYDQAKLLALFPITLQEFMVFLSSIGIKKNALCESLYNQLNFMYIKNSDPSTYSAMMTNDIYESDDEIDTVDIDQLRENLGIPRIQSKSIVKPKFGYVRDDTLCAILIQSTIRGHNIRKNYKKNYSIYDIQRIFVKKHEDKMYNATHDM